MKIFIEYGLDFDNNKYGFGVNTEYEYDDQEVRKSGAVKLAKTEEHYFRIWIGKRVMSLSNKRPHIHFRKKNRNNFKIIYGRRGTKIK
ncbi:MAG: hypothetical protein FWC83_01215 [Alphaproteobacteria bacterium]|nr:hypothetical protein [Alphaproteobacteria bacterium]